jgi:hypothetical protein
LLLFPTHNNRPTHNNLGNRFTGLCAGVPQVFIEVKGMKFAHNRTFLDCLEGTIFAIFDARIPRVGDDKDAEAAPTDQKEKMGLVSGLCGS